MDGGIARFLLFSYFFGFRSEHFSERTSGGKLKIARGEIEITHNSIFLFSIEIFLSV